MDVAAARRNNVIDYAMQKREAAARDKASVCSRSPAQIVGSNPAGGVDVCLLASVVVVRYRSLQRADHSSRGVLPSVVCVWV